MFRSLTGWGCKMEGETTSTLSGYLTQVTSAIEGYIPTIAGALVGVVVACLVFWGLRAGFNALRTYWNRNAKG